MFSLQCFHVDLCTHSHSHCGVFNLPKTTRAIQDYYSIIVVIWHTWAETFFFAANTCAPCLSVMVFFLFTPLNPLCFSMGLWQDASLLGRWDSNQSGLPRGASDHRARLPNCPQAGRQAGRQAARFSRCNTCSQRAGAAVLAGLLSMWDTVLDRWRAE